MQCVDCVKSQQKESRGYRTVFGAQVRTGPPLVTYTLIGVCILVYIVQMALGWSAFTVDYAFVPVLAEQQPYRFLTTAFLHSQSSIVHILFNMMALWTVGRILEPAIGRIKFLLLFLISAVGGSVGYLLFAGGLDSEAFFTPVVGASGAVFGLFGAIFLALKSTGRDVAAILGTLAINLVLGFVIPGLAWQAHLGGLVTGLALGAVYIYAPAKHRTALSIAGSIAIPVLLVVAAVVKYSAVGLL